MSALVSIIIPVYNLENYIGNCLEKLLCQTYKNLEIICVDDGSTDDSAQRIKEFADKDSRIIYIYQENAGVSAARNKGLDSATGDYIMFVDGDDYLHYQAVEIFVDCIEKTQADIVCAPEKVTANIHDEMINICEYSVRELDYQSLFSYQYNTVLGKSVWSKIYNSNIARLAIFNTALSNGEDTNYIVKLLCHNLSVYVIDKNLYYYFTRENSCVRTSQFSINTFDGTLAFEELCRLLKNSNNSFLKAYCLQYMYQTIFYNRAMLIGTDVEVLVFNESRKIGNNWIKDFLRCKEINLLIKISFVAFFYSHSIYEFVRMIQDPTMKDFYKNRKNNKKE